MAAAAKVYMAAATHDPFEDMSVEPGFTAEDRKSLIMLEADVRHLAGSLQDLSIRMGKMEDQRVSTKDIDQIEQALEILREEKADKGTKPIQIVCPMMEHSSEDHETRLRAVERRTWLWIGGATAILAVLQVLLGFLRK